MKLLLFCLVSTVLIGLVLGDATSELKAKVKDCDDFYARCGDGCKTAWSGFCSGGPGNWGAGTECKCDKWGGVKPPKVKQDDAAFRKQTYKVHNDLRCKHGSPPFKVDRALEDKASKYAQHLASIDQMTHSDNPGFKFGENLYFSTGIVMGKDAVEAWYDEVNDPGYTYGQEGTQGGTLHFTQVVWKKTKTIGCGRATSSTDKTYVVCNYQPMGNMMGEFVDNVATPQSSGNCDSAPEETGGGEEPEPKPEPKPEGNGGNNGGNNGGKPQRTPRPVRPTNSPKPSGGGNGNGGSKDCKDEDEHYCTSVLLPRSDAKYYCNPKNANSGSIPKTCCGTCKGILG